MEETMEYPKCKLCERGELLPLDTEEASAWVCSNPSCGFYVELIGRRVKLGRARVEDDKGEDTDKEG
jgi:hypothetical protein